MSHADSTKRWRANKRANGICGGCPAKSKRFYCDRCHQQNLARSRKRYGCQPWKPGGMGRPPKRLLTTKA
jgi:hypothetical protein